MTVNAETEPLHFEMSSDPVPGTKPSRRQKSASRRGRPTNESKKDATRTEVKKQVEALIALIGVPLSMRDPYCGGVLVGQRHEIGDALADIAMDNDRLMAILMSGGDVMKYMKLITALSPVGITIYQHHFMKTEGDEDTDHSTGADIVE